MNPAVKPSQRPSLAAIAGRRRWLPGVFLCMGTLAGMLIGYYLPKLTARHHSPVAPGQLGILAEGLGSLSQLDVAAMNMDCADGLRGSEGLQAEDALHTLDQWAARVREETERHLPKFRRNPGQYQNSEAYFRMLALVTVLQQDCGVRYNPERIQTPDFSDSRDLFLHGLTQGRGGTCVSMPVAYVAVGRRLGYPLKLVTAKAHLFARWESSDGKERLNLEATSQGLNCFPDEYYHRWPVPMTPQEIAGGQYLKSLTPPEELAVFLSARGHCLEAGGRWAEAQVAHAHAHALAPQNPVYLAFLAAAVQKELPDWQRVQVDLGQGTQRRSGPNPETTTPSPSTTTTH